MVDVDDEVSTLTWVKGEREAGIGANEEGAWVFLGTANRDTKVFEDAIDVLKAIFADEIVEVIGYHRGAAVYSDLANANAPAAGLNKYGIYSGTPRVPALDQMEIRSWSGALDFVSRPQES